MSKHGKLLAALAGLGLVATAVWGDNNVLDHVTYKQNATSGAKVDANGNAYVTESAPSANNYSFQPSVISGVFVPVNDGQSTSGLFENCDSTSVIDCRGYNRAAFLAFPSPTTTTDRGAGSFDSLGAQLLAVEVRAHSGAVADSQSTFAWREDWRVTASMPATNPPVDTIGSLVDAVRFYDQNGNATNIRFRVLPTERLWLLSGIRNNNGTAAGVGTGTTRGRVLFINKSAAAGGIGLPPFMSVRIRSLVSYNSLRGTTTGIVASDSANAQPMRLRCDLVLWRE